MLAKRSLGKVTLKYRINGGRGAQRGGTSEWRGGDVYTPADVYYREMRGTIRGDRIRVTRVKVWFEGRRGAAGN